MATHQATIEWESDGRFASGHYSRAHDWSFDGGAIVRSSSSPAVVPVPMSDPAAVDPEEALIASAAACHMLWFLSLRRRPVLTSRPTTTRQAPSWERTSAARSR